MRNCLNIFRTSPVHYLFGVTQSAIGSACGSRPDKVHATSGRSQLGEKGVVFRDVDGQAFGMEHILVNVFAVFHAALDFT